MTNLKFKIEINTEEPEEEIFEYLKDKCNDAFQDFSLEQIGGKDLKYSQKKNGGNMEERT